MKNMKYEKSIVIHNDDVTSYEFVKNFIMDIGNIPVDEAGNLCRRINEDGSGAIGPFSGKRAQAIFEDALDLIKESNSNLKISLEDYGDEFQLCGFCKKPESLSNKLTIKNKTIICDSCIIDNFQTLSHKISERHFNYTEELLKWHFAAYPKEEIITTSRSFPLYVRADLQLALDDCFLQSVKQVGVHCEYAHMALSFSMLINKTQQPVYIGPLKYTDLDTGEKKPVKCLNDCIWLRTENNIPYLVLLTIQDNHYGTKGVSIEIAVPNGPDGIEISEKIFDQLAESIKNSKSYRGKVLSLEKNDHYGGMAEGIRVHKLPSVSKDEIILSDKILEMIDKNIFAFSEKRQALKDLGLSAKKGLLFYGPPGTGKTHTIRYLAQNLKNHTTLLITAEQVGLISDYFSLARLLQPSILVIEDVDLIGRDRQSMNSPCEESLLNKLLNEMDGLKEDAEIFFVLTTNRVEMLEPALASRPGRIDQSIEFPLPAANERKRLIDLYGKNIELEDSIKDEIVDKTKGVSAAFIKELMRRSVQVSLGQDSTIVESEHVREAIEEMLLGGGKLNVKLLGGNTEE